MNKPYREQTWRPIASSDTELSLSIWTADYERCGYETVLKREQGRVRLYVRMAVGA